MEMGERAREDKERVNEREKQGEGMREKEWGKEEGRSFCWSKDKRYRTPIYIFLLSLH